MNLKSIITVGFLIFLFAVGFFVGRCTSNRETIRYVKGEVIRDTVEIKAPVSEETPLKPKLPVIRDTIYIDSIRYITEKVDTASIISDYILMRKYEFNVFDNNQGKLDISQDIVYNKLLRFEYEFTPITKTVTIHKRDVFTPFVSGSYNTLNHIGAGGGLFIKDIGLEYIYNIDLSGKVEDYHTFGLKYKF